jgi:hypothetical protein
MRGDNIYLRSSPKPPPFILTNWQVNALKNGIGFAQQAPPRYNRMVSDLKRY